MPKARHVLIAAAAGLSIGMLPMQLGPSPFGGAIAYANNGNSGGGNGGGGNGGGGDGGGGGNGGGGSNGGDAGRSGDHRSDGNGGQASTGKSSGGANSEGGLLKALLRGGNASAKTVPAVKPEEKVKNLHARLGSLNSLQRDVHAYLNSNSPQMALIRDYVVAKAQMELAEDLADALEAFDGDPSTIEGLTLGELNEKMTELDGIDTTGMTDEQLASLEAEKAAVQAAIDLAAAEEAVGVTVAPTLEEALIAAGNPNFESEPIDPDILGWAEGVLEVKIDEMKELLTAQ